ncbi:MULTISPECIES: hypothetical protein [Burkholderia]|uniref:hypothetical protein n=1 Tax=Burkholderia TaxID=32008 RepID=UPI0005729962|nr:MULTISPECIES: hypothetical protein [Burkholderia]KVP19758.1 hypothetical protein WJ84_11810 [Burkholderia ubonensis]ONC96287.1 hypothetical protein AQ926_20985 [Burkholderia pseudomallei]ONC98204.1 hypothetical protein AQ925_04155 [Burkholderia pseudomallei]ONC98955.1 hypothetical protein AQ927_07800 [Burkholderia pseudomallei]OND23419.1 hypothetical protein AQ930_10225 [Burkholderia pseudomallei]
MGQVIPIKAGKHARRARQVAALRERIAPAFAGAVRLIGRLLLDSVWFVTACGLRILGRYFRIALTFALLVAVAVLCFEFAHHWPHPRNAIVAAVATIAVLCLREALYRLDRRVQVYSPFWR